MEQTLTEVFKFEMSGGVSEYHAIVRVVNPKLTYAEQVEAVMAAYAGLLENELCGAAAVFKRFFVSDAANQTDYLQILHAEYSDCPLSIVEQSPLDGSKIALWVYLQKAYRQRSCLMECLK